MKFRLFDCLLLLGLWQHANGHDGSDDHQDDLVPCPTDRYFDIVFLIDSSGSMERAHFKEELKFISRVIKDVAKVGEGKDRIGLLQFSNQVQIEFHLNTFSEKEKILHRIEGIEPMLRGTDIAKGMRWAIDLMFKRRSGDRRDFPNVLIVTTDGKGRTLEELEIQQKRAEEKGISVHALGFGNEAERGHLLALAGDPNRVHLVESAEDLQHVDFMNFCHGVAASAIPPVTYPTTDAITSEPEPVKTEPPISPISAAPRLLPPKPQPTPPKPAVTILRPPEPRRRSYPPPREGVPVGRRPVNTDPKYGIDRVPFRRIEPEPVVWRRSPAPAPPPVYVRRRPPPTIPDPRPPPPIRRRIIRTRYRNPPVRRPVVPTWQQQRRYRNRQRRVHAAQRQRIRYFYSAASQQQSCYSHDPRRFITVRYLNNPSYIRSYSYWQSYTMMKCTPAGIYPAFDSCSSNPVYIKYLHTPYVSYVHNPYGFGRPLGWRPSTLLACYKK